jgi:hypothetical protein
MMMPKQYGTGGGGIGMKNLNHVSAPKTEPNSRGVDPGYVSRCGNLVGEGTPYKTMYTRGYNAPLSAEYSNGAKAGVAANHVVRPAGTQGRHGSAVSGTPRPITGKPIG